MARISRTTRATNGRRRTSRSGADSRTVVTQITQLVTANETLQRENQELRAETDRLRAELRDIGNALGRLTGGSGRGRSRRAVALVGEPQQPKRQRRPITDPAQLERRKQALAKARAARAEKLAAARAAAGSQSA